ncbi:MAG: hypothetical protein OWT28_01675 [Firmicutes bacterium]|nr:hypothetical protein [Bacillota bacterium]
MLNNLVQTGVLALMLSAGIWFYGGLIASKLRAKSEKAGRAFARKFRLFGFALALPCFIVGLLYRGHVINFTWAAILYIPEVVGFAVGLWRLQPYLTAPEEEMNHE